MRRVRVLEVGLLVALSLSALQLALGSSTKAPLPAVGLAFGLSCSPVLLFGFPSAQANLTNHLSQGVAIDVFFVWYDSADQVVAVGARLGVDFAPGQTLNFYNTFLTPGAYIVKAFAQDQSGNALTFSCPVNVFVE